MRLNVQKQVALVTNRTPARMQLAGVAQTGFARMYAVTETKK